MTKVTSPLNPPIEAKFRFNDKDVKVKVTHAISLSGGTIRNQITLPGGKVIEVDNSRLKF
jgi:hypothetical protein